MTSPLHAGGFWDPVPFSWPLLGIMIAALLVLTVGFVLWTALQSDEPATAQEELVDRAVARDQEAARLARRRFEADAGRTDAHHPELR
ncbi:hypothetical protein ACXET9_11130 [Brachybacterium sp. DNPG3]